MLSEVHENEKALVLSMRAAPALCDNAGDVVTASIREEFVDQSQRRRWLLFESTRS
jgi:starvation-inducible DNA-binding protein